MDENKTYTAEEVAQMLQSEADKRVTAALNTAKSKWEEEQKALLESEKERVRKEAEENAKLTADELAKKEFESKLKTVEQKEKEYNKKMNLLDAKDKLATAGVPKEAYESMIGVLVTNDTETTLANVENYIGVYTSTKNNLEQEIKTSLGNVPAPKSKGSGDTVSKDDFNKMTYAEKLKIKTENPNLFSELIK